METQKFIPYAHQSIEEKDISAVAASLRQDIITRGACVEAFEASICEKVECKYAVAFCNASCALASAFQASHISQYDHVVSSPNTFIASVGHAVEKGAMLHLIDIDSYGNMDPSLIKNINLERSRGKTFIVPIHFAGVAIDMYQLDEMICSPDVVIIEDAAHALGSLYPDGTKVGSCTYSDMTVFSFHPAKNITCGEGGMVTTNSEELFLRLKKIRNNCIERDNVRFGKKEPWYYEVDELSNNYNMTEMQAALGLSQLESLERRGKKKRDLVSLYRRKIASVPGVSLSPEEADSRTHFHLFVINIEFEAFELTRTQVMEGLSSFGIGSQYHYIPLYNHPALLPSLHQKKDEFPMMNAHMKKALSLPLFDSMTEQDIDRVVSALRKVLFRIAH